jgi:ribonuclease R
VARERTPPGKAPFPTKEQIAEFIAGFDGKAGKREIARAFSLDADQKQALKRVLREMADEGAIQRGRGRRLDVARSHPTVSMVEVTGTDADGEVLARPLHWPEGEEPPVIYMAPQERGHPALAVGERALARLSQAADGTFEGHVMRRLGAAPGAILGVYRLADGQGRIRPTDKRSKYEYVVARADAQGASPGELVEAEVLPGRRVGLRQARIVNRLGKDQAPAASLIAIHEHGIPHAFDHATEAEAESAEAAPLDGRADLRAVPLVTIDGADARDFDDAVWAEPATVEGGGRGWHAIVAIADVAWYVRPGSALDRTAFERGNSVYFPDRVVPMLPEALSNGWCSLKPDEDRPCLVAHLWIGADGAVHSHRFERALMRSAARFTYEQIQAARDGEPDAAARPLMASVVTPLYDAFEALDTARRARGVLDLDLPERRAELDADGKVKSITTRVRLDSHRLIEEFMIAANVAAAETLERRRQPAMYRVHDQPSPEKIEALREYLDALSIPFAKGQAVRAATFNRVLERVRDQPFAAAVNQVVLRSQAQAVYSPDNLGHFGLALRRYCHFTSPIRRYADLLVHRALIRGLDLGVGALPGDGSDFAEIGEHISATERRASAAERDTMDRLLAAYLADRVGHEFAGTITGVTRFGLFVSLNETGGDGLAPVRSLGTEYFSHDEHAHELRGDRSGLTFRLGDPVRVRLQACDAVTGSMLLDIVEGGAVTKGRSGKRPADGARRDRRPGGGGKPASRSAPRKSKPPRRPR